MSPSPFPGKDAPAFFGDPRSLPVDPIPKGPPQQPPQLRVVRDSERRAAVVKPTAAPVSDSFPATPPTNGTSDNEPKQITTPLATQHERLQDPRDGIEVRPRPNVDAVSPKHAVIPMPVPLGKQLPQTTTAVPQSSNTTSKSTNKDTNMKNFLPVSAATIAAGATVDPTPKDIQKDTIPQPRPLPLTPQSLYFIQIVPPASALTPQISKEPTELQASPRPSKPMSAAEAASGMHDKASYFLHLSSPFNPQQLHCRQYLKQTSRHPIQIKQRRHFPRARGKTLAR